MGSRLRGNDGFSHTPRSPRLRVPQLLAAARPQQPPRRCAIPSRSDWWQNAGMRIRPERPTDRAAIAAVTRQAFGRDNEARLIDALRAAGDVVLSLVAEQDGVIIGHILFSRLAVSVDGREVPAVTLSPIAVAPDHQRQRIGSRLVEEGLDQLRHEGIEAVFVFGHTDFYPRFGFQAALAARFEAPYAGSAFMALELRRDALAGEAGRVVFPRVFDLVGN
jgi:putative acetyltransferase